MTAEINIHLNYIFSILSLITKHNLSTVTRNLNYFDFNGHEHEVM